MKKDLIVSRCQELLAAYSDGLLGQITMPEDSHPVFRNRQEKLIYFTLPMALNYQRDSYNLWKSALKTYEDVTTSNIYHLASVSKMAIEDLREKLLKHRLALQPNKHPVTWHKIANTVYSHWGTMENLFDDCQNDYLSLRRMIQHEHKKDFPYLSGPKIFNYWSFIMMMYGGVELKNRDYIEIAPDTHITKCSVKLGVISAIEADQMSKEEISSRWRKILEGSGIAPIDMHPPLWFWSRNGFRYILKP